MVEDYSAIGTAQWIKNLRVALGLTQAELAERVGVTFVTVSRWENGLARPNRVNRRALVALAMSSNGQGHQPASERLASDYAAGPSPR